MRTVNDGALSGSMIRRDRGDFFGSTSATAPEFLRKLCRDPGARLGDQGDFERDRNCDNQLILTSLSFNTTTVNMAGTTMPPSSSANNAFKVREMCA